jgi:L-alanine-DL-glutamate epimerase-like enolase superfamily enzyme
VNFEELGNRLCDKPLPLENGFILLDDSRPGLGLNMNEEALSKEGYADFPLRNLREYWDEA